MNSNIKKTIYFLKRNGIRKTYYAVKERLYEKKNAPYEYQSVSVQELERQREELKGLSLPLISIVVPAYRTPKEYMKALIESVLQQTYENWELIIADASDNDSIFDIIKLYRDLRISHLKLDKNDGISENTNRAIEKAKGEYTALLDHDDVITPDALYEMSRWIRNDDHNVVMVYSDEDKCNEDETIYFDLHKKLDYNKDLLLTNNYICHFTMIRTAVLKNMMLRKEYDGAQDFDLFLRVANYAEKHQLQIGHVDRVLYHWRSHELSTAANPQSKLYAYQAGQRAIADYLQSESIIADVIETPHVGFYRVKYEGNPFEARKDLAAIVKRIEKKGKTIVSAYDSDKNPLWEGLMKGFSGYMHRASLQQDVFCGLIQYMVMNDEWAQKTVDEMKTLLSDTAVQYEAEAWYQQMLIIIKKIESEINKMNNYVDFSLYFDCYLKKYQTSQEAVDVLQKVSFSIAEKIEKQGMLILYDPYLEV